MGTLKVKVGSLFMRASNVRGPSVLQGTGTPSPTLGISGDFYIDVTSYQLYGPKVAGVWGSGVSLIGQQGAPGPQGPQGPQGPAGIDGEDGLGILSGFGVPSESLGEDGSFYIDTQTLDFYGPKTSGSWGTPVPLANTAVQEISASTFTLDNTHWNKVLQLTAAGTVTVTVPSGLNSRFTTTFMFDGTATTLVINESSTVVNGPTLTVRTGFAVLQPTITPNVYNLLGVPIGQDNLNASTVPTADNDVTEGYGPGSFYVVTNVTPNRVFYCTDATEGGAVWIELTGGSLDEAGTRDLVGEMFTEAGGTYNSLTQQVSFPPGLGPFIAITGTLIEGETLTAVFGNGMSSDTIQWLRDGVEIPGATSITYDTVSADVGANIQVRAGSTALAFTSSPVTIESADFAPIFNTHPSNQTVVVGQTATFTVAVNAQPTATYQWQVSTDEGGSWANVTGGTGATTTSYTTPTLTLGDSGNWYRCVATNSVGSTNSNPATLTVNAASSNLDIVQPSAHIIDFGSDLTVTFPDELTTGNYVLAAFAVTNETSTVTGANATVDASPVVSPGNRAWALRTDAIAVPSLTHGFSLTPSWGYSGFAIEVTGNAPVFDNYFFLEDTVFDNSTRSLNINVAQDNSIVLVVLNYQAAYQMSFSAGLTGINHDVPGQYACGAYGKFDAGTHQITITPSGGTQFNSIAVFVWSPS